MDLLTKADGWFINLVALCGAGYFLWSMRNILADLKQEISDLKSVIEKIFAKNDDHEKRLSRIEGICRGRRISDGDATCGD